ncbi:sugar ABC transporter ATP-binding protein [Fodinicurvata halophila]|uniref:Sugar ABC transporter ATP-binding protein n=2 Tax=Fodinicurvata halophila TaxID=1419723 RepID=A0ABV8UGD9_9PROT
MQTVIETSALTKRYPGVVALDAVDFDLKAGEVHVLFGENGAGKSTLIAMIAGASQPSGGSIRVNGEEVQFQSVADARGKGISAVFQEFSLVPTMTVAENIFLGDEPKRGGFTDKAGMLRRSRELFRQLDFAIDPKALVSTLRRAEQQMVEIAKAFHGQLSILILDEPTASLTEREVDQLFQVVEQMKARGVGIIYISHRIQELKRIADRVTVLRDGRKIGTVAMAETSEAKLVEMMAGRAIDEIYPRIEARPGDALLEVEGLKTAGVAEASLSVRPGEILGVAGLVGSGKSRCFRALFGLQPLQGGRVRLKGRDVTGANSRRMMGLGVYYLPPDRKSEGLQLAFTSRANLIQGVMVGASSRLGVLPWKQMHAKAEEVADSVELPPDFRGRLAAQLSGGNQQKTLFGRGLGKDYDLYIFDEPTVGVDMGARAAIYGLIQRLTERGKAVVVISSDLPEVMNLSHRLLVFSQGRISAELPQADISEATVLAHFFED